MFVYMFILLPLVLFTASAAGSDSKLKIDQAVTALQQSGANCFLILAKDQFDFFTTLAMVKTRNQYKTVATLGVSSEDLILQRLVEPGLWSIVAKSTGEGSQKKVDFGFEKVHNYVIVGQTIEDIQKALSELSSVNSWNPHAKFLVYFFGNHKSFRAIIAVVLEVFWKFWVVNVVVMHPPDTNERGHTLATYFPFHSGGCGREASSNSSYTRIGNCLESVILPEGLNTFPNKVPDDLNRCLVKVGTVPSPPFIIETNASLSPFTPPATSRVLGRGIEMAIINTISEAANFEVQVTMSYWQQSPEDNQNATAGGLLQKLWDRQIDVAVGTISPTIREHLVYDFSVQYMQDISAWVVPTGKSLPHWIGVLLVFKPIVFVVMLLLLVFFWLATSRIVKNFSSNFRRELTTYKNSATFFLITVGLILANAPTNFPRTRFLKFLLFLWTLMSFYWSTAFNATLISVITNTAYEEGIETEEQIIQQKMTMFASNRTLNYFYRANEEKKAPIDLHVCPDVEVCLANMSWTRDSALAMSRNHFDFVKRNYRDDTGYYKLKTLKSNIVTVPIELLLSKGNPLLGSLNKRLLYVMESGLIQYWTEVIASRQTAADARIPDRTEKVLTLDNLRGSFILWLIGIGTAIVVFIGELFYHQVKRVPRNGVD